MCKINKKEQEWQSDNTHVFWCRNDMVVVSEQFIILYDLAGIYASLQASQKIPCHRCIVFTASCCSHHHILLSPLPEFSWGHRERIGPYFHFPGTPMGEKKKISYWLDCLPTPLLRLGIYPSKLVLRTRFSSKSFLQVQFFKFLQNKRR